MKTNKLVAKAASAVAVVALCAFISCFLLQLALIDGASMTPTYKNFQFVLINKTDRDIAVGDVVAFKKDSVGTLIKRVAALPGDTVKIENGKLTVNEKESPVYKEIEIKCADGSLETVLGEDEYFVLGDNLSESKDSRYEIVGKVGSDEIIGKIIPQKSFMN